ncbi:hypothetical protein KFZ70_02730 [Tamlana fucoidanivorans]|uniref:DUF6089 domain-containing protein n=1 Tax=Allotamlana fucoidanivorans TaxID=2583814 RepID=A0A5C4SEC6_9FLAO|nr:DUF6089 family protein [Tamlana fucoidanivorans]TNJ41896.1 hypothetical protein FGF67_15160 [Tamlana fucoidanivorans]
MRRLTILILSILSTYFSYSQINEIGVFLGGSNFIGDVGATNYIAPNAPTLGVLYKWNASERHSWRASILYSDLIAEDIKSDDPRRQERDYYFNSNLLEISAGLEFTFMDFDLHSGETAYTPYLYSGLTATKFDNYYFPNGLQVSENTSSWTVGIPMVAGFKVSVINSFVLGIEIGARYTFTDEMDGSLPSKPENQQYRFGNINNNDWYVFSGITLTYTFGENPCYCVK